MKKSRFIAASLTTAVLAFSASSQAESLIDGMYQSAGNDNGKGKCTLVIKSVEQTHKYGDQLFELESSGDGACEWSAIGMSKSYAITGGLVTNSGTPAFVKVSFPFGPAGAKLEVVAFDTDGSVRNEESFTRVDDDLVASN